MPKITMWTRWTLHTLDGGQVVVNVTDDPSSERYLGIWLDYAGDDPYYRVISCESQEFIDIKL